MKKLLILIMLLSIGRGIFGQDELRDRNTLGLMLMAGGRYDNYRMCVATPPGTKGGAMADIMLVARHRLDDGKTLAFHLPVMRPVLFGAAFNMLQFEPEMKLEYVVLGNERTSLVTGPGLGLSFHYGPDYTSDKDNPGESFFAMGPYVSWLVGVQWKKNGTERSALGLQAFYVPLFANDRSPGTVLGGALYYAWYL